MNKQKLEEDLTVDMRYTKYLKIPQIFKSHFGNPVSDIKPDCRYDKTDKKVTLSYTFNKSEFTKVPNQTYDDSPPHPLTVRMGYTKYLKIPEDFKKKFGNPVSGVNPSWDFYEDGDKITIQYIFNISDLVKVRRAEAKKKKKAKAKKSPSKKAKQ